MTKLFWIKNSPFKSEREKKSKRKKSKPFDSNIVLDKNVCSVKATGNEVEKKLSLLAGKFFLVRDIALTKEAKNSRKKSKSFGGKIVLRKKSLPF